MKRGGWLLAASVVASTSVLALLACATNESSVAGDADAEPPRSGDGGVEAGEAAAEPCTDDCEYFPEACAPDVLCIDGPFDPKSSTAGLDWRAEIDVIAARSPSDVWVAGTVGALAHFDGTTWSISDASTQHSLRALWLRDSAEITFGVADTFYTRGMGDAGGEAGAPSPGGWIAQEGSVPAEYLSEWRIEVLSGWAPPGNAEWLWMSTRGGARGLWRLHRNGGGVLEVQTVLGGAACVFVPCREISAIHGASSDELWAVGPNGATIRVSNAQGETPTFTAYDSQTFNALYGVWAASAAEAWAVGASGTVRRYRGDPRLWEVVADVPTRQDLHAVGGSSSSDVWVVGAKGLVLHYDGTAWSRVKIAGVGARRPNLTSVWSSGPGHVWIGGQGVVLSLGGKP